jgi:signal transduction histidine kinase/CheY-like chemotaxis protein
MMRLTTTKKRILILFSGIVLTGVVLICLFGVLKPRAQRIYPVNGQLDLRSWDESRDGILSLSGGWDFYWKRFQSYQDVVAGSPATHVTVDVPAVWNNYIINGKNLPGFGYGTYLLKVINAPVGKTLALKMPTVATAYELYIDNRLVSSSGKAGIDKEHFTPGCKPQEVEFTPAGKSFTMIIHVANFTYAQGGMYNAVNLGTPEQIRSMDKTIADKDLFLFGALIIMAFYYLNIFLLRREDKSTLYFVSISVLLASLTAISGDFLIYRLIPFISFEAIIAIYYIILGWFPISAAFIIKELFPEENSKLVLRAAFVYAAGMTLLILLTPISFYSRLFYVIEVAGVLIGGYCFFTLTMAFLRGKKDSFVVLLGALVIIVCAVYDILFRSNTSQLGSLFILFIQPLVLARRFSEAFRNVKELSQKLLKLDKIKDEFLANTSHELRTPLNAILGLCEAMLRDSESKLNGRQMQNLTLIAASSRRLASLVNDILDYYKLKNGEIRLNIKPIKLSGLIQTVVEVFQQLSQTKGYQICAALPAELPLVLADENRVIQILYNLIGNAAKFTTRGYIKVTARVTGAQLEVCVSDTGEGIPADKLEEIFKSFEQLDTSMTRKHSGAGLGLSITKQLVELQGGSIRVESTPGPGSAFYFTLPILSEKANQVVSKFLAGRELNLGLPEIVTATLEKQPAKYEKAGNGTLILAVDDDALNLITLEAILKTGSYSVTTANSGKAALEELIRHRDYSLVILDVMMPEMSGYEVCRRIRESKSNFDLPVLMLTAMATTSDIVLGLEAGANDYLPKPFEPDELLARVGTLINLKKSVDKAIAAETAFMQAQIKPHFLYNTLSSIYTLCEIDPQQARRVINEFANYLRTSFDFENLVMTVPLTKEMSLVKSYVEIETMRFGDQLNVEYMIDETSGVKIPPLSIQPLVENAINHGIRKKGGSGTVTITIKNSREGLFVAVADDGLGILPGKLAQLLTAETGQGVGLRNIDFRLKKLFGRGLSIESEPGKGTRVMFMIPAEVN